ncbi:MAG: UDP-N-acetylmuramate--L-alanine ligase [Bacteroidetes bacterium]|nr:MAG: UDP-N-acetylmuramate--L-alanine ligase [Bacteroidota bacterium]
MFSSVSKVHFVGIGGIGMSGIAEILINQGFQVSGSDLAQSDNTDYLSSIGAKIFIGHNASNLQDAEVCVYSSAVKPEENPETIEAYSRNIPVLRRAEMLAETSRLSYCLAISGTHGKTTTTSMCGLIMMKAGFDPTVIVGGRLKGLGGTNARLGKGEWIVVEADEYDRSFLQLLPTIAIINNVEEEHLDIYKGFDDLQVTFAEFANKVPFYGFVAVGLDDPGVKEVIAKIKKKIVSFGLSKQCDFRAEDIKFNERSSECEIIIHGENKGNLKLNIPGLHNVKNALGAIAVCYMLGIDFDIIRDAISEFSGVYRRFEIKGEIDGITVVDDYAHHPTEIRATLQAARNGWQKRIVAVFQPHTFTRTQTFYKEFGSSFDDADIAIITDVYPAREAPIEGVTGKLIADAAVHFGHKGIIYIQNVDDVYNELKNILEFGDMLITIGAGNIFKLSNKFLGR